MIPLPCPGCGALALSLRGQIQRLDSYLLGPGGPPRELAGEWHTKCLAANPGAGAWAAARLRNFVDVRGYSEVARAGDWVVLEDPRDGERMGLSDHGALLVLPSATLLVRSATGDCYRERKGAFNLHLPMPDLIAEMQATLVREGACSMSMMFDGLTLWSVLDHPDVLADARFVYDEELREGWGPEWLSAGADYGVFIPAELVPHCR